MKDSKRNSIKIIKKSIAIFFIISTFLVFILSFAYSGNILFGTYYFQETWDIYIYAKSNIDIYIKFCGNKVTKNFYETSYDGTYIIKDNEIIMKFIYDDEVEEVIYSFEKKGKTIFLDGAEFTKK